MAEALGMLSNPNYLVFILAQLVVSGMMQFYFLGTGQFMQDRGISGRNVSAVMGIAQAVQAAATMLAAGGSGCIRHWIGKSTGSNGLSSSGHFAGAPSIAVYVVQAKRCGSC